MSQPIVRLEGLSYIILYVASTEKSTEFYRDLLGLELKAASPAWVEFQTGSTLLALHQSDKMDEHPPSRATEICFTVADLHTTFAALKERSVDVFKEPHVVHSSEAMDHVAASFRDPDGHLLSIYGVVLKSKS